jgi:outer membrane protein assembly factor BamB
MPAPPIFCGRHGRRGGLFVQAAYFDPKASVGRPCFSGDLTMSDGNRRGFLPRRLRLAAVVVLATVGADWPNFRGPRGVGVADDRGLPARWSATENVLWKAALPGPGASSPITSGGRVFVTCYSGYGVGKGGDPANLRRHLLCVDAKTGNLHWQKEVAARLPESRYSGFLTEHGYASSTPATDGKRVYVFFSRTGVLAFDLEGRQLWQTLVGDGRSGWGSAASLLLHEDLVIVNATVESNALVALDKRTGKEVWRVKGLRDTWSTPVLVALPGGGHEVVLNTLEALLAFEPKTGKKLWECAGIDGTAATSTPVARDGVVYVMGAGVEGPTTLAVRAGGRGDVTQSHLLWKQKAGTGICSPVLYGEYLFWVNGQAGCLRADTGQLLYRERLYQARSEYTSPVAADGKLYLFTRQNGGYVLAATGKFGRLAHNDLGDASTFSGSPAISDGRLFIRSEKFLYCIGGKE